MKILKTWKLKGWQTSIFKISCIAFGIAIANTWPEFFGQYTNLAWIVALIAGLYITKVWWDQ